MDIDVAPLGNAIERLDEGLARYRRDVHDAQIRDGLIQRFEFTWEMAHRAIRRFLVATTATSDAHEAATAFPACCDRAPRGYDGVARPSPGGHVALPHSLGLTPRALSRSRRARSRDGREHRSSLRDNADFQYVIRSAAEQGLLLGGWPEWRRFREMRARSSHSYDEAIALQVVDGIPAFLAEVHHLHGRMSDRLRRAGAT